MMSGLYFFTQDEDCHWFMIPKELRERWNAISNLPDDSDEKWDKYEFFQQYRTGGGITHIFFTPEKDV